MKQRELLSNNLIDLNPPPPSQPDNDNHSTEKTAIENTSTEQPQIETDCTDEATYCYGFERGLEPELILGKNCLFVTFNMFN